MQMAAEDRDVLALASRMSQVRARREIPRDHGLWPDDGKRRAPVWPNARQDDP